MTPSQVPTEWRCFGRQRFLCSTRLFSRLCRGKVCERSESVHKSRSITTIHSMAPRQRLTPNPSSEESPRSRSSSPSLNDKGQHSNNDENSSTSRQPPLTSMPLAIEKQAEIARDRHDIFNLIALVR